MGWKSTIEITRKEAIKAIIDSIDKTPFDEMSNSDLEALMYDLSIGSEFNKPYYGYNFIINDDIKDIED